MEEKSIVEVYNLIVSYHHISALWDINLTLPKGKLIGILGRNGAGKSTFLKAILGLTPPFDKGHITFQGNSLAQYRSQISYVSQRQEVDWDFPISVREVVMMGRYPHMGLWKRATDEDHTKVEEALSQVGLLPLAKRQISQLSGGQQQKVFLARALAQDASLYLMDEPFSALDATTESTMFALLQKMVSIGKTIVMIHHDLHTVPIYFDWSVLLNVHVVATGPPTQVLTPELLKKAYGRTSHLSIP